MNENLQPATELPPSTNVSIQLPLHAHWAGQINRVVIGEDGRDHLGVAMSIGIHLSVEQAAQLAADLIEAVSESGAGEVPDVLLMAFGNVGAKTLEASR